VSNFFSNRRYNARRPPVCNSPPPIKRGVLYARVILETQGPPPHQTIQYDFTLNYVPTANVYAGSATSGTLTASMRLYWAVPRPGNLSGDFNRVNPTTQPGGFWVDATLVPPDATWLLALNWSDNTTPMTIIAAVASNAPIP
jgi:hypothetical protein